MPESDPEDVPKLDYETPQPRRTFRRWMIRGAIVVVMLIAVAFFLRPGNLDHPRWIADRLTSAGHLRQIGTAILIYMNDFHGEYPDSFGTLLNTEDIHSDIFVSPRRTETPAKGPTKKAIIDQLTAGGHLSYVYLGSGLTENTVTPDTVVAYEIPEIPDVGCNVLFGDGHVEWGGPPISSQIDATAKSGKRPVTMPSPFPLSAVH